MYHIETYCFKSKETDRVKLERIDKKIVCESQLEEKGYTFHGMEMPVFRKVEENTEYIVVEMFSLPKSLGNSLGTAYAGAVCIKVDADINDVRLR